MRGLLMALCILAAGWTALPSEAHAQQALSHAVVTELVVVMLLESDALRTTLALPDAKLELAAAPGGPQAEAGAAAPGAEGHQTALDLFGPGIDVSTEVGGLEATSGSVMLSLKPNWGRRSGELRWTFRF